MFILSNSKSKELSIKIAKYLGSEIIFSSIKKHNSGELELFIPWLPNKQCILILSNLRSSNDLFFESLLQVDYLAQKNIEFLIIFIPFIVYQRDSSAFIQNLMVNNLLNAAKNIPSKFVLTLDNHIKHTDNKIYEIEHFDLFESIISNYSKDHLIVSPDNGSVRRLYKYHCNGWQTLSVNKTRNCDDIVIECQNKDFYRKDCIIIDDIVESANTICSVAKFLKVNGAKSIVAFITHNLLSNESIYKINTSSLSKLTVLGIDNTKFWLKKSTKICTLDVSLVIANNLQAIING